jgi:acetyl/propionyl-CoA carboxylase alpha subunit
VPLKIKKLFIANRGEICRRIAVTAQRLGIETVALTDREAPPVYLSQVIDQFVQIKEETTAVYLDGDRIISLAKTAGADSIHPGFGFLSENSNFAKAVETAGLIWVGPTPKSIDLMANKALARDAAIDAKVPCIQGLQNFNIPTDAKGDFSEIQKFANDTGYPLLIKAAMGGGGKGMRTVRADGELADAVIRAHSEAKSSFGDGTLICEQYLETSRHVEVQILADKHGNAYAIGDRDCSLQRRHQKVIEEAPAPDLQDATRKKMQDSAIQLAKAVGYDSTGTVEYLVDWTEGKDIGKFYFLEMNTRLQVEHPVTEEVFGMDLVEWQLRVASGEKLPDSFANLPAHGHSVEVRLYAEDVNANFFPAPGPVATFKPGEGPGVRWEIGLDTVDEITGNFDPMIAKLITTGENRKAALQRMTSALRSTFFAGPEANIAFLAKICSDSPFCEGPIATSFLNNHLEGVLDSINKNKSDLSEEAEGLLELLTTGALFRQSSLNSSVDIPTVTARAFSAQGTLPASESAKGVSAWKIQSQRTDVGPDGNEGKSGLVSKILPNGKRRSFCYAGIHTGNDRHFWVGQDGFVWHKTISRSSSAGSDSGGELSDELVASVPGKVTVVKIAEGDEVKAGDCVFILESMKMEFEVKAQKDGTIESLNVAEGDQVKAGQSLAEWK